MMPGERFGGSQSSLLCPSGFGEHQKAPKSILTEYFGLIFSTMTDLRLLSELKSKQGLL